MSKILLDIYGYCEASDPINKRGKNRYDVSLSNKIRDINPINIMQFERGHDFCFASIEKKRLVINFQGSDDILDSINNFKFSRCDNGDIHVGFKITFDKFKRDIHKILRSYEDYCGRQEAIPTKQIVCCGHSRGGALAIVCSYYIAKAFGYQVDCIPYGSPKPGGKKFRDAFCKLPIHCTRVFIRRDPVTWLPFRSTGHRHVGFDKPLPRKWWHYIPGTGKRIHTGYLKAIEDYYKHKK